MTTQELRIGNWIADYECEPNHFKVESIEPNGWVSYRRGSIRTKEPCPIPLTPEILEKCGFHKHNNAWVMEDFSETEYNKDFFTIWNIHEGEYSLNTTNFPVKIESLHQLQNLFFALVGEELNYTP